MHVCIHHVVCSLDDDVEVISLGTFTLNMECICLVLEGEELNDLVKL